MFDDSFLGSGLELKYSNHYNEFKIFILVYSFKNDFFFQIMILMILKQLNYEQNNES